MKLYAVPSVVPSTVGPGVTFIVPSVDITNISIAIFVDI